jgi:large subunit ribosomal protein L9
MADTNVILKKDVPGVGEEGDVLTVKAGFARNYLFPNKIAVPKNKVTLKVLEKERAAIEKRKEEKRQKSKDVVDRLQDLTINIKATAAENDKLYGSITNTTIAEKLAEQHDIEIDKRKIEMEAPIKTLGEHTVTVKLYEGITADLKVVVEEE